MKIQRWPPNFHVGLKKRLRATIQSYTMKTDPFSSGCLALAAFLGSATAVMAAAIQEQIVTNDLVLPRNAHLSLRLVVRASQITIDGNGATLTGPGQPEDLKSLENAGLGILIDGCANVTLKNLK